MKIAVIGTGLIGSQVVRELTAAGHDAAGHSRSTGIDVLSGDGLDKAVSGAQVVVDVTNSPTFDDASIDFFRTSVPNLLAAAQAAGTRHVVTLSIVGVDQVPDLAYYRAKTLQEDLVKAGPIPYSIVRATQFMEFVGPTMDWTTDGDVVRLPARSSPSARPRSPPRLPGSPRALRCRALARSRAPTCSRSTSSDASRWTPPATSATSSPTRPPACSPS
jgi:uncharacterized protein YbjT (DUF2867 family)